MPTEVPSAVPPTPPTDFRDVYTTARTEALVAGLSEAAALPALFLEPV